MLIPGEGIKLRQIGWGIATFPGFMPNLVVVEWLILARPAGASQQSVPRAI